MTPSTQLVVSIYLVLNVSPHFFIQQLIFGLFFRGGGRREGRNYISWITEGQTYVDFEIVFQTLKWHLQKYVTLECPVIESIFLQIMASYVFEGQISFRKIFFASLSL